jgi:hypothetical protein
MSDEQFMDGVQAELLEWTKAAALTRLYYKRFPDSSWSPEAPNPYFARMTSTGLVQIGFTSQIFKIPDMRIVNNGTIYLSQLQILATSVFARRLEGWSADIP